MNGSKRNEAKWNWWHRIKWRRMNGERNTFGNTQMTRKKMFPSASSSNCRIVCKKSMEINYPTPRGAIRQHWKVHTEKMSLREWWSWGIEANDTITSGLSGNEIWDYLRNQEQFERVIMLFMIHEWWAFACRTNAWANGSERRNRTMSGSLRYWVAFIPKSFEI